MTIVGYPVSGSPEVYGGLSIIRVRSAPERVDRLRLAITRIDSYLLLAPSREELIEATKVKALGECPS